MKPELKEYIKANIHLIDEENFSDLYKRCKTHYRAQLTQFLLSCDIKPDMYMTTLPAHYLTSSHLTTYTISPTVTHIGKSAFCMSHLEHIDIPESVLSIDTMSFAYCENLTQVTGGKNLIDIGPESFYGCTSLKRITLPASLKIIGDHAFRNVGRLDVNYLGTREQWKELHRSDIFRGTLFSIECVDGTLSMEDLCK